MDLLKLDDMHDTRKEELANKWGDLSSSLSREEAWGKTRPRKTLPNMWAEKQGPEGFMA
jgi:hypothetical protein